MEFLALCLGFVGSFMTAVVLTRFALEIILAMMSLGLSRPPGEKSRSVANFVAVPLQILRSGLGNIPRTTGTTSKSGIAA